MPGPPYPPPQSLEERLAGWVLVQERLRSRKREAPKPAITLSRQYGCEGFPLASRLQERLQALTGEPWAVFDKALIDQVTRDEGVSRRLLENLGEPAHALEALGFHPMGEVTSFEAYRKVAGIVLQVARAGNAILVGRGAAILCQELEACRHFRLEAGLPWRAARMSRQLGLPLDDAEAQVKTRSRERERFIRECLGADIADHALYHAIFNNERLAPAEMAEAIVSLMPRGEGPRPSP